MKSSKLSDYYRALRRERIMEKRGNTILQHRSPRVPTDLYPHSNTRQRARYARQIAAGQIRLIPVTKPKAKRTRKTGSA
jgi:hypothetical protein